MYSFILVIFLHETYVKHIRLSSEKKTNSIPPYVQNQFFKKMLKKRKGRTAITSTSTTLTDNDVLQK